MLWGGAGDLLDNWAIFETRRWWHLEIRYIYNLEEFWDFGFVQVSTDGGKTWTSLCQWLHYLGYDPSAHPTVVANLPGLRMQGTNAPVSTPSP